MSFKLGFVAGMAAGWWLGSTPADERRAKLDQIWAGVRDNPRVQRVTETVVTDARRIGDAVEQRFVSTTDTAVNAVAGTGGRGESSQGESSQGESSTRESAGNRQSA